jgi:hypothetical protein
MTKFQKYASLFIAVCLMILVTGVCCKISRHRGYKSGWNDALASAVPDTVTVTYTIVREKPVEVTRWKYKMVYVPVTDTITQHDTTYVALQFEKKEYADSAYRAVVSGFHPSLDWIEVYQRTQTVTNYIERPAPRWSFGVTAGPCILWDGNFRAGIGVAAGVQFRFGK